MRQRLLFIIAIFLLPLGAQAQRAEVFGVGGFVSFGPNTFSSDATLPVAQPPNPYSSVASVNPGVGVNLYYAPLFLKNVPLFKDISFGLRGAFEPISRTLKSDNNTVTLVGGVITQITFTHDVDATFTTFPIDFIIYSNFLKDISFFKDFTFGISPQLRFLTSAHYTKSQRINNPDIDFLDGSNSKTEFDDELAGKNPVLFGAGIYVKLPALRSPFKVFQDVFLVPEFSYTQGFANVAPNLPWKISGLRGIIGLEYAAVVAPKQILKDTIILRDTTLQLVAFNAQDTVILLKSTFRDSVSEDENAVFITAFKEESYTHFTPNPAPLLLADMRVRFLKNSVETESISLFVEDSVIRRTIVTQNTTLNEADTVRFTEFPHVMFYPEATSETGVASWQINITQKENLLKTFRGEGNLPPSVDWNFALETDPFSIAGQPMDYAFSVTDREGQMSEIQRGKITFELQKKRNLPDTQLPLIREEFYFSKAVNAPMAIAPFKKHVLKTSGARMIVETEAELGDARTLAGILKIPVKNIAVGEIPARFKHMIAVILQP